MGMHAEFLEHAAGCSFCVHFDPPAGVNRRLVVVPAFGEEMNKSRALVACTARALCGLGVATTVFDLYGTGDSPGELAAADWEAWREELRGVLERLIERDGSRPILLAVRSGVLLLDENILRDAHVLCWQPVVDGGRFLQQFLRLRVMAEKFAGREESVKDIEARLAAGECVEVAGYPLSQALTAGLGAARLLTERMAMARRVDLFEFRSGADAVSPALRKLADAIIACGGVAAAHPVDAEQFWATQEIAVPQAVVSATLALIEANR